MIEVLGLKKGGTVKLRLDGSSIVIEPIRKELKEKAEEWKKMALSLKAKPLSERTEETWKWMSIDYARRKLGIC